MSDLPEEPEDGDPGPDEDPAGGDEADANLRGWIHPDDRLWRHPSEVATPQTRGDDAPQPLNPPPRRAWRGPLMVLIAALAVMAAVAWLIVLLSPESDHPLPTRTDDTAAVAPITTLPGSQNTIPAAAVAAGHSIVELRAVTDHGTATLVGVAVAEGGMVVTTADLLAGLRSIDLVGPGGRLEPASVVGTDSASDVALVQVPEDVPVAPFSDDNGLDGGAPDLTLTLVSSDGALALHCTPGSVTSVGTALGSGPASGMPTIVSSVPAALTPAGSPLLNASGAVLGILYAPGTGTGTGTAAPVAYLPTDLVVGVADDLRSGSKVVHGWLGVSGTDAPNGTGAKVATVDSNGPAAGRLQSGQVIVALNQEPVRTMAELRARLYVLAPGTPVAVSVQAASGPKVVELTLGNAS